MPTPALKPLAQNTQADIETMPKTELSLKPLETIKKSPLKRIQAETFFKYDPAAKKDLPYIKITGINGKKLVEPIVLAPLVAVKMTFSVDIHPSCILTTAADDVSQVLVANQRTHDFKKVFQHKLTMRTYSSAASWSDMDYENNAHGFIQRSDWRMRNNTWLGTWLAYRGDLIGGFFTLGLGYTLTSLQIGYAVHQKAQRGALGSLMTGAILQEYLPFADAQGLKSQGKAIQEIEATVLKINEASIKILEHAGWMKCVGDDPAFKGEAINNPRYLYQVALQEIKSYKELIDKNKSKPAEITKTPAQLIRAKL